MFSFSNIRAILNNFNVLGLGNAGDVTVFGYVYDILNAASNASFTVNVMESDYNVTRFIESSLKKNIPLGDTNKIIQTINVLSSVISSKNCSNTPNCTILNRESCLEEANTCGSCLSGYKGVSGNSNSRCVLNSLPVGVVGSICKYDDDCLLHRCDNSLCVAPQQTCQTSVPNSVCSGYGTCKSMDASGNAVQNCTIMNTLCTTSCSCQTGRGGVDCSLDTAALEERSKIRVTMCSALTHVISVSEKSPQLFDSIASALLSAYDKDEIFSISQLLKCSSVLQFLGSLASSGFLKGTKSATQQIFAEISSQFVGTFVLSYSNQSVQFNDHVQAAVTGMTNGIIRGMSKGQKPISVMTRNIRVTMISELVSTLSNATFSPPPTPTELNYGSMQPKIVITGDGASKCSSDGSYAQISTLQYGINPRYGSDAIKSPLLQFSSSTNTKSSKLLKSGNNSGNVSAGNIPSYYVTLQYSTEQNLDLTAQTGPHSGMRNVTIPECVLYDSVSGKYVSCGNCKLSSYTNFNVTFGCFDIKNLCPSTSKKSRRLNSPDEMNYFMNENEYESSWDLSSEVSLLSLFNNEDEQDSSASAFTDFSTLSVDDDSAESSDDLFDSRRSATTTEFGSILRAINSELMSTLSLNPFSMDLSKATPVLALVGSLCGSIILGLLFFLRWDKMERHKAVYLLDEREKKAKNQIALDLRRGGNGVTLMSSKKKEAQNSYSFIDGFNLSMTTVTEGRNTRRGSMESMKSNPYTADDTVLDENDPASNALEAQILIAQFSNHVLPEYYTSNEKLLTRKTGKQTVDKKLWKDAFTTVRRNHYLTAMFYGSSLRESRTLRFLAMSRKILLFLFIDTVVFGVFFPSDASCHGLKTKSTCLEPQSKVSTASYIVGAILCWLVLIQCQLIFPILYQTNTDCIFLAHTIIG